MAGAMRRGALLTLASLAWLLAASAGSAQVALGSSYTFDTRHGRLEVLGGEVDQVLTFRAAANWIYEAPHIDIRGGFALGDQPHDWVLLSLNWASGACTRPLVIARVSAEGVNFSPDFGGCAGEPLAVRVLPGSIEIDLPHPAADVRLQTFRFDGITLNSTLVR